ncbi:lanthionine synthetase C family protein [Actinocorallia sp. A-T 12471]|uniref:lanthionine synthetase C family protein n=1 Tax=Actinocorallia sp. A-T 12471 TaxID=3089813 RepID=UPI0029D05240|nr:lanthionine synthetase C family protein [Actinocorallia sp. A-T 12471]MDX6743615.1 lanthionine synthetase C family protein [Actinocorallia sp. A-T 12471]
MTVSPIPTGVLHPVATAVAIADRLIDPVPIITATGPAATSLSRGLAGTALLHARLSRHDRRYAAAADAHWSRATHMNIETPPRTGGVFNGIGALAASLILGTPYLADPGRHQTSVDRSVRWLAARAAAVAAWQRDRRTAGDAGTPWQTFDVINGLAGIGRVLLAAAQEGHADAEEGLHAAQESLIAMIETPDGSRPGWWRPAPQHPAALADPHNVDAANTGLAHGIAGPLAFLAACQLTGHGSVRQAEAIRVASDWLLDWRDGDGWPPQITADDLAGTATAPSTRGRRDAWCYGAPGIGVALHAAGHALADPDLIGLGLAAIDALATRSGRWDTEGATICHGTAGVLLCAAAAGSISTTNAALAELTAQHDPRLPFLFSHSDHGTVTDEPGLLVGAAGIALLFADMAEPETPATWTAALLMPAATRRGERGPFHSLSSATTEGRFPR